MAAVNVSHAQPHVAAAGAMVTLMWGLGAPRYLHALGLHLSTALMPLCSTSPTACKFCAGQDSVRGGGWTGYKPQQFPILSPAPGGISGWLCVQLSLPTHRLCWVTVSDPVIGEVFAEQR